MRGSVKKWLFAGLMAGTAFMLTACGGEASDITTDEEAVSEAGDAAEDEPVYQITLEDVARLNDCSEEELDRVIDQDGYVKFLGNCFTEEAVENENEAAGVLGSISELAGMGNGYLQFYRVDESTATGLVYYSFYQVDTAILDGEELPARYYGNMIKLITDKAGRVQGYSAFLNHNGSEAWDESAFLNAAEAEEIVSDYTEGKAYIYSDYTEFNYWDDEGTVAGSGKIMPVWLVYTDNTNKRSKMPYQLYIVNALFEDVEDAEYLDDCIAEVLETNSLGEEGMPDSGYTSELFFSDMEDGGNYSYTLDMKWAEDLDQGYRREALSVSMCRLCMIPGKSFTIWRILMKK